MRQLVQNGALDLLLDAVVRACGGGSTIRATAAAAADSESVAWRSGNSFGIEQNEKNGENG